MVIFMTNQQGTGFPSSACVSARLRAIGGYVPATAWRSERGNGTGVFTGAAQVAATTTKTAPPVVVEHALPVTTARTADLVVKQHPSAALGWGT
ncbi:hypothetical protein SAMN04487818_11113 [Actinokineospora terrae]|uniref:Uncharacterized protein n=2 Tax=Actinokineospora terrae TaxID=155974 RepID=A0A1H9WN91_9PSEU|nr:hypothetical protein SAMN04487818_11113 [Actinokineospora terrae]